MKLHRIILVFLLLAASISWLVKSNDGFKISLAGLFVFFVWRLYGTAAKAISGRLRQRELDRMPVYSAHGATLRRTEKGAIAEEKPLGELDRVLIVTTDQGPFVCDMFLTLLFQDGAEWRVPLENPSYQDFYEALGKNLPLDAEQTIMASCSTACANFPLWEREKAD